MSKAPSTAQLLDAVRAGASADELNVMLAQMHEDSRKAREQRIRKDAALVANRIVAATPAVAATVEVLLSQARELLEAVPGTAHEVTFVRKTA
jgi:hypothetical protein